MGVVDHLGKEVTAESYVLEHILSMKKFKDLHISSMSSQTFLKNVVNNLKMKVLYYLKLLTCIKRENTIILIGT